MKKLLTAGAALGALMAGAAQAQVQSAPGFFGSIDGLLALPPGKTSGMRSNNAPGEAGNANRGFGFGVDGQVGYAFGGGWDVAIGGGYLDYGRGKQQATGGSTFRLTDGSMWRLNADVGYTISGPGYGVRPFLGVQYVNWRTKGIDTINVFSHRGRTNAIGPEFGVDASMRITDSLSLFGGVDTAFLFGKVKDSATFAGTGSGSDSRLIWQIGGKLGLDWEMAPLWHLALGYKLSYWDGIQSKLAITAPAPLTAGGGRSGLIEHGPFIRIAYNWGAPPSGPEAPKPVVSGKKSYIVFFDFDRAVITPTAATTIKQAAADAKAGKSTRLDVTGHADKSGGDAYNMALSLRRANAVKDQLVREGIPAAQIAVVGRGESMPLVQTADGVREPQNRRVEIVLN